MDISNFDTHQPDEVYESNKLLMISHSIPSTPNVSEASTISSDASELNDISENTFDTHAIIIKPPFGQHDLAKEILSHEENEPLQRILPSNEIIELHKIRDRLREYEKKRNIETTETQEIKLPYVMDYRDVDHEINTTYLHNTTNNSNIIDIIGVYVKGQKILYTEAKTVCEQRLTILMLPSIFFTVSCSIINLLMYNNYGKEISSILNGGIAFILALINYLKLDARAEAHRASAYKYDKLLSYIEFQSGKQLYFVEENTKMDEIINNIENQIKEIKETNPFVLPEIIRYQFSSLASINVFTEVKKIENEEMIEKNKLTNVLNEIYECEAKIYPNMSREKFDAIRRRVDELKIEKKILIENIIRLQNKYMSVSSLLDQEIISYYQRNKWRCSFCCDWLKV